MNKRPHFKALLTYLSTEDGGMISPVSSGFRSVIRFPYDNEDRMANSTFLETELVFPGDTAIADIILGDTQKSGNEIYTGLDFDLFLNSNKIGTGIITDLYKVENKSTSNGNTM